MRIDSSGDVGIGTTSPQSKLHVSSGSGSNGDCVLLIEADTDNSVETSNPVIRLKQDGGSVTGALSLNSDNNMLLYNEYAGKLFLGVGNSAKMTIINNGNVGIGDTTPSYKLDVSGTIRATGDVVAYSDIRVKKNINTIENAVDTVNKLRGVTYQKKDDDEYGIGVIAQELEKVLPHLVKTDEKGMKAVAYGNITGVLIEAIKEQDVKISEQDVRISRLEALVEQMLNSK